MKLGIVVPMGDRSFIHVVTFGSNVQVIMHYRKTLTNNNLIGGHNFLQPSWISMKLGIVLPMGILHTCGDFESKGKGQCHNAQKKPKNFNRKLESLIQLFTAFLHFNETCHSYSHGDPSYMWWLWVKRSKIKVTIHYRFRKLSPKTWKLATTFCSLHGFQWNLVELFP